MVDEVLRGLENGPGDPNMCTLFTGARGTGKTALMTYISEVASQRGWLSASVTASQGMLEDIVQQSYACARQFVSSTSTKLTSLSIGSVMSAEWRTDGAFEPNWRTRMEAVVTQLDELGIGLIITVDEVKGTVPEMKQLVNVFQHFVREKRRVALLMAGLPHNISLLVNDDDISFLRRATLRQLGNIPIPLARNAIRDTIVGAGRTVGDASELAAEASQGYPYLIQLIGYYMWEAHAGNEGISDQDVEDGIEIGYSEFERRVIQATYRALSDGDIRFLKCMLPDEGDSAVADITKRLGVKPNYTSKYKSRLIEQGIVGETRRGYVAFELPMFKEFLQKTAGS